MPDSDSRHNCLSSNLSNTEVHGTSYVGTPWFSDTEFIRIRLWPTYQPFYTPVPTNTMDEQFIQEVKAVSREIVEKKFPEEVEYFDSLFDLIIPELQEIEPGKETEFLRKIRTEHPSAFNRSTVIITAVFQVLARYTYYTLDVDIDILPEDIWRILEKLAEDKDKEEYSEVPKILIKNIRKAREKAKRDHLK